MRALAASSAQQTRPKVTTIKSGPRKLAVLVAVAEQRTLELRVGACEGVVVPVEAAARFGRVHEQRQQHAREQCFIFTRARTSMRAREDRGGRLAQQLVDRELRVGSRSQRVCAVLDERLHERAVLVERRLRVGGVLLEGERQLGAALDLREQRAERPEAESPQSVVQLRSAHGHDCAYAVCGSSPLWQVGHQYAMRALSPCGHDSIGVPQRRHACPLRR